MRLMREAATNRTLWEVPIGVWAVTKEIEEKALTSSD